MRQKSFFRTYRRSILLALSFVVIEKTAWIIEPTVFGDVIDAMIGSLGGEANVSPTVPLLIWIGIFGINSGIGTYRRYRDEKIYLSIHNDLAARMARKVNKGSIDASRAAARMQLSGEVISFYEYRVPDLIEQTIDVGGAVLALSLFDWRLGTTCATILLPVIFIGRLYNRKVAEYQMSLHDEQEEVFQVYSKNDPELVRSYYAGIATLKQKIANWGAFNFGFLRLFLLGIFLVILYVAIDLDDFSTGNVYSVVAYVWTFVTSSEYLPEQLESITSSRDLLARLQKEDDQL